jgi:hypothetical protein
MDVRPGDMGNSGRRSAHGGTYSGSIQAAEFFEIRALAVAIDMLRAGPGVETRQPGCLYQPHLAYPQRNPSSVLLSCRPTFRKLRSAGASRNGERLRQDAEESSEALIPQ